MPGGAIYCPSAKYWPNSLELGQICPQYNSDCRATISTVGWLPYRKVNGFLMRILYRQQDSKTSGTSLMTNTFMNIIMTICFSLAWLCSNTINHTIIAGFWQLDFRVELMDNLLFRYSSHEIETQTAQWQCCRELVGSKAFTRHDSSLPPAMALQVCLSSSARDI